MSAPKLRPVAEHALLVEFSAHEDASAHQRVLALDAALMAQPFAGFSESVPALVALLVEFDPAVTDHAKAAAAIRQRLSRPLPQEKPPTPHQVQICYDAPFSPDLDEVARQTGLPPEAVIAQHLAGDYRVAMYGFAPGYAYLSGVPAPIRLPRKPAAIRDIPAGSVIIAAGQCLVTTLTMPTGWWIIGRSPTAILTQDPTRPFLFDVGDSIRFCRVSAADIAGARA